MKQLGVYPIRLEQNKISISPDHWKYPNLKNLTFSNFSPPTDVPRTKIFILFPPDIQLKKVKKKKQSILG